MDGVITCTAIQGICPAAAGQHIIACPAVNHIRPAITGQPVTACRPDQPFNTGQHITVSLSAKASIADPVIFQKRKKGRRGELCAPLP